MNWRHIRKAVNINIEKLELREKLQCITYSNFGRMASDSAHRKFYDFDMKEFSYKTSQSSSNQLLRHIKENVMSNCAIFSSPFGPKKVINCDYTASGCSLKFIENFIFEHVLPYYGSTHTTTSVSSLQTSLFRQEARDIIRNAVRASEHDRVIFTGSGATSAIHKLLHGLDTTKPLVVFIDPFAHHSSFLPFREKGATVIRIKEDKDGGIDISDLVYQIKKYHNLDVQRIGCFSAASNITGALLDDFEITKLLHQYDCLAFWDYATAAPYIEVEMNPFREDDPDGLGHKDAIFFSLHKFIGGVQTPGVLVAKKNLFQNETPTECGGGTVFFVTRESHRYLKDVEEREEGGTPPIVETIRGGLVMQLKMNLVPSFIMSRCRYLTERLTNFVKSIPEIVPLGNMTYKNRLPILSFNVTHQKTGKLLHYNFISTLLNDLYGIQTRGGCACAGPYAQDLLGIDEPLAKRYEELLVEVSGLDRSHLRRKEEHSNVEVIRPGFIRLNLSFVASEEEISFILSSVRNVCERGWRLLPQYTFNPETGEWNHHTNQVFKGRQWLQSISYEGGIFSTARLKDAPEEAPDFQTCLRESEIIFDDAIKASQRMQIPDQSLLFPEDASDLLWFVLPHEVKRLLNHSDASGAPESFKPPFTPVKYPLSESVLAQRRTHLWVRKPGAVKANVPFIPQMQEPETNNCGEIGDSSVINCTNVKKTNYSENFIDSTNGDSVCNVETMDNCTGAPTHEINSLNVEQKAGVSPFRSNAEQKPTVSTTDKGLKLVRWMSPPASIFKLTLKAIDSFKMISNGDKVLVCLSGGKDSLSLLHTLHQYQYYAKPKGVKFTLGAVTVDPQSSSYNPKPLIPYLASLNVPYYFETQGILKKAMELEDLNSICSFCARMKRGRLYTAARREGYNVLALGQHLDDLAESFIMSTFHNGRLRTMKAAYTVQEKDLRIIRPLIYVREKDLRLFAEKKKLPIIPENCPGCFEQPKERHRTKQLLAQQEVLYPGLFGSLRTAMEPLFSINETGIEDKLYGKAFQHLDHEIDENDFT